MEKTKKQLLSGYGFILRQDNYYLLVQRAAHDTFPGLWELPGGGVEKGEDPRKATEREVLEEAGLTVKVIKPLATTESISSKGHEVLRHAYLCQMNDESENVTLSSEHSALMWIHLDDTPPEYLSLLVQEVLKDKTILTF